MAGGTLGKYCTHAYAHATREGASALPSVVKGSDMVAYEIFRALGVEVLVRPIMQHIREYDSDDEITGKLATHNHVGSRLSVPVNSHMEWGEDSNTQLRQIYEAVPSKLMKVTWLNEPAIGTKALQLGFARISAAHHPRMVTC
jgi:hypothetical protein